MTNEEKAFMVGNDKKLLRKRLNAAKKTLRSIHKPAFKKPTFDFESKRLIGDGYYLQWRLRRHPDQPESYENQQTTVGTVSLHIILTGD